MLADNNLGIDFYQNNLEIKGRETAHLLLNKEMVINGIWPGIGNM